MDPNATRKWPVARVAATGNVLASITFALAATSANAESYFEWLRSNQATISSARYADQAEVDRDLHGVVQEPRLVVYDDEMRAARMQLNEATGGHDDGSGSIAQQLRHEFEATNSGTLLLYWESRYPSSMNGFSFVSGEGQSVDGVKTHKAFQISRDGDLTIEPRVRFRKAPKPYVGMIDVRGYGNTDGYSVGSADSIAPMANQFYMMPDTWTRHWFYLDFRNDEISYWVADETRSSVAVLDGVHFDFQVAFGGRAIDQFWFEHNSSQARQTAGQDPVYIWGRNLAVLRDISDPEALIARSDDETATIPKPPKVVQE